MPIRVVGRTKRRDIASSKSPEFFRSPIHNLLVAIVEQCLQTLAHGNSAYGVLNTPGFLRKRHHVERYEMTVLALRIQSNVVFAEQARTERIDEIRQLGLRAPVPG